MQISRKRGYFRIRLPEAEAISRLRAWVGLNERETPGTLSYESCISATQNDDGSWSGVSLFAYHNDGWTVFDDVTGYFSFTPGVKWLEFARNDDFVKAFYYEEPEWGQLVAANNGTIVRELLIDKKRPSKSVNVGQLDSEGSERITEWRGVMSFMATDEHAIEPGYGTCLFFEEGEFDLFRNAP